VPPSVKDGRKRNFGLVAGELDTDFGAYATAKFHSEKSGKQRIISVTIGAHLPALG
jgi:hypothetical protein